MGLGKFQAVDIRSQWKNEEYDFTPWLSEEANIQILADELGLDLEVEGIEVSIGSFLDLGSMLGISRTAICGADS